MLNLGTLNHSSVVHATRILMQGECSNHRKTGDQFFSIVVAV
jgi:hypothetical protein